MKIETLKIDDNNPIGDDEETELNEDGEKVRVKKSDGGPWNKVAGQAGGKNDEDPDSRPSTPGMIKKLVGIRTSEFENNSSNKSTKREIETVFRIHELNYKGMPIFY